MNQLQYQSKKDKKVEPNSIIILVIAALMLVHLGIGVPLFVVLGLGSMAMILGCDVYSITVFGEVPFSAIDSWALLAMPLFILAGEIISRGQTANNLVRLGEAIVGWIRGGLGMATILGCFFFAGTSGSSSADTITIGRIMVPAMKKRGYQASYAASLAASGGILGVIVPPSLIFIIYGVATSTSIGDLFLGGIFPGLILAIAMCTANYFVCKHTDWGVPESGAFSLKEVGASLWHAKFGLGAPVIILGGIYSGVFTPTEAASVAVAYVTIVELLIHRSFGLTELKEAFLRAAVVTGVLAPIIAFSVLLGEVLAILRVPSDLVTFFFSIPVGPVGSVALIILVLLIVGSILEPIAAILVVMPILLPIGIELGFDSVHFGVFVVCTLAVGFITPPVGINLFAASAVSDEPFLKIAVKAIPAFFALIIGIVVIAAFPNVVLWFR
jgi:C4-dicarboxylate transporter DctM subunit|tara:strand:- start:902 stop:2227 length:1326 start_codon:yes stop_codon:yes gene_type:complete